ncbi:MAG: hypothetical protein HUJ56_01515 [Erysipelotrichaceae bacterium]|nr:hypothetical protein [Erysipelotrichaceae bacterium]
MAEYNKSGRIQPDLASLKKLETAMNEVDKLSDEEKTPSKINEIYTKHGLPFFVDESTGELNTK